MTVYYTPAFSFLGIHVPELDLAAARFDLILLLARAAFLVAAFSLAAVLFTRWRRAAERDSAAAAAAASAILRKLSGIETDLTRLAAALAATDAHVTALGSQLTDNSRTAATPGGTAGYGIAIRMARGGATREELVAVTGLAQQEAELIIRLHARPAQGHAAAA